eukprot:TRINITY_DN108775_c0_g1_i1.p1 TRINITY_DN108775_c0_g1~~TRINITY_DN108775_c0_g1_i1.p1  ORF type:complete len:325 (-),score=41.49 TRINITY_DN108775_c0_g1_i1:72-1046(-)
MGYQQLGAKLTIVISVLVIIGWWALAFRETGWVSRVTPYYSVDLGLFYIRVKGGVYSILASGIAPKTVAWLRRTFTPKLRTTEDFKEYLCGLPEVGIIRAANGSLCQFAQNIHFGSIAMIVCISFGTVFLMVGSTLVGIWLYQKPRAQHRFYAKLFYFLGVFTLFLGLIILYYNAISLSRLPPINQGITIGPHGILATILLVISCLPLILMKLLVGPTHDEVLNEGLSTHKKIMREVRDGDYGSTDGQFQQPVPAAFPLPQPVNTGFGQPIGGPPMMDAYQSPQQPMMMGTDGMFQQPFPGSGQPPPMMMGGDGMYQQPPPPGM